MTLEEALTIANEVYGDVNVCYEYKKAYHFIYETDDEIDGENGVVIIKESGDAIGWMEFITDYMPEVKPIRKIRLSQKRQTKKEQYLKNRPSCPVCFLSVFIFQFLFYLCHFVIEHPDFLSLLGDSQI